VSNVVYYAIPAFFLLIVLEVFVTTRRKLLGYETKDTFASLSMGVGNVVIQLGWKGIVFGVYSGLYQHRIFDLGQSAWDWILLFFSEDLCYYWFHRLHHEVRFFWAGHVNHHSSQRFNLSTALRQPWTTPITGLVFWLPLPLLGFHPVMILTASAISLLYQFWIHTEAIDRLGPLEWFLNTPSHHRVHHGANVQYLDRNYAGILIIWDRLFGSFEAEGEPVRYGITKNIETYNPFRIAFHEWVAMLRDAVGAKSPKTRLSYLLEPPGWSPDGSTLTAPQMQRALRGEVPITLSGSRRSVSGV